MKPLRPRVKDALLLWLIVGICAVLTAYRLSLLGVDNVLGLVHPQPELPGAEWILNSLFLFLMVLLWVGYRGWRQTRSRQDELEVIIASVSPDVLLVVAPDRTISICNPAVERMFGYRPDELHGRKTDMLYSDRRLTGQKHEIFDHLLKMGFHVGRATGQRKDGATFPLELVTAPLRERPGAVLLIRDITERQRAESALRDSERRYRLLAENVSDVIWTTDLNLQFTYVSPSVSSLSGYSTEEATRKPWRELLTPPSYQTVLRTLEEDIRAETVTKSSVPRSRTMELEVRRKDGSTIWTESQTTILRGDNGMPSGVLGVTRDITERKRIESQLWQAQKLETIGRLAGGIAHDFNNLLTVINGYSSLLHGQLSESDRSKRELVEEIGKAGERASALTHQLLAFSRRQALQPKMIELNALILGMEKMLRRLIGEDVELVAALKPNVHKVFADPGQIEQVIMNLVVNARDAMLKGGRLIIETHNIDIDGTYALRRSTLQPGRYAMFAVSDTGCGMDAETQSHIFEPFFTTKEKGKGTGLGLSTVYGIVTQSGGDVWVYSELDHGTTFKICLPAANTVEEAVTPSDSVRSDVGGSETILLVEDEGGVRRLASTWLRANGYTVLEARNGHEAISVCELYHESINLVLTDVIMPQMSGRELYDRLAGVLPGVKVLYMSGYTDEAIAQHGILEPGIAFLSKPFGRDVLTKKVREVLSAGKGSV